MKDSEWEVLATTAVTGGAVGLFTSVVRGIVHTRHGGWKGFFRGLASAVLVGVTASWGLADTDLSITMQGLIIACCSYVADDVLEGLLTLGKAASNDPIKMFGDIAAAIRGRSTRGD